ncbi:hypothetical protein AMECASPLE_036513 [Ameca splendens]|uniref:Uncharacterized protein n=1 Tax=Ameca splendens TaxID=208324 RepID=A0ABV0Y7W9_9TELE
MFKASYGQLFNPLSESGKTMAYLQTFQDMAVQTELRRSKVFRETPKRLRVTLEKLQRSKAQKGCSVDNTTISFALNKTGIYGRVAGSKSLLKESHKTMVVE